MKFILKIFPLVSIILAFLIIGYLYYVSEIVNEGRLRDNYKTMFYISVSFLVFSITILFTERLIRTYLLISTISIAIGVYSFEIFLVVYDEIKYTNMRNDTISQFQEKMKLHKKETGMDYDTREKFEYFFDFSKENKELVVDVPPYLHIKKPKPWYMPNERLDVLPLSGISNSETVYCNENGYFSKYVSDRYGFNNPDDEWESEEIEYLLIGDSFGHGACVNRPNDIASVLRSISEKNVLTLSYAGNGPLIEYATLKEYLPLNTKNIIWLYSQNDIKNLNNELSSNILNKYFNDDNFIQNLKIKQAYIDNKLKNIVQHSYKNIKHEYENTNITPFYELQRNNEEVVFIGIGATLKRDFKFNQFIRLHKIRGKGIKNLFNPWKPLTVKLPPKEFKDILLKVKKLSKKNNSNLYFVYLEGLDTFRYNVDRSSYNKIKEMVKELSIPFLDTNELLFKNIDDPKIFFPYGQVGHYNILGYKSLAKQIHLHTLNNP